MTAADPTPLAEIQVPANVNEAVHQRWPVLGPTWSKQVIEELTELCDRYQATPQRVLPARYGFVVATDTPNGPLVMRSSPDPAGPIQAKVATALADLGVAPAIHHVATTTTGTWTVMDRITPGTPIYEPAHTAVPIDALAALLRPMVGQPPPSPDIPSLTDWLRDRLTNDNLTDIAPRFDGPAPANERKDALALLDDLTTNTTEGLCHADTSLGNILIGPTNRLYLIDPRGMTGDIAYDTAVLSLKFSRLAPPPTTTATLTSHIGIDPDRAHAWATVAIAARV